MVILMVILLIFLCPLAGPTSPPQALQAVDGSGQIPVALVSQTAAPPAQPEPPAELQGPVPFTQSEIGIALSMQKIHELLLCMVLGYCPDPGTPLFGD